ncbi:MAG TPA: MaoC family dehydratase [Candidatus Elarobacter sp.]|jgi:acyl dehydratase|nr:MaoC family dehydratase [Candidatus Elarobacter sp.]
MERVSFTSLADLQRVRGQRVGESAWFTVTQDLVDEFARLTNDPQWIHVDPERARRESPLGTTIAHGFLTLSLLSSMIEECIVFPTARMAFNYGFDRVRFVAPVPIGAQIRGTFALEDVREIEGGADMTWRVDVEIRDAPKPALAALWLTRVLFAQRAGAAAS